MRFADCSLLSRRPQMITSLPVLENFSARANPMPVAPPVIRTVFPPISKLAAFLGVYAGSARRR